MASHESDQIEVTPNHAMEDANWVHERSRWKCKINGCTDAYAVKCLLCQHLDNKYGLRMEVGKSSCPSIRVGGPRQQNHHAMNVQILSNPYTKQKRNEKKALDRMKKKAQLEWDELQTQAQQMEQVKWPLLVHLASEILLGTIGLPAWGLGSSHKVHGHALKRTKTLLRQLGQTKLLMQSL
jgi:hypothetical protein